MQLTQSYAIRGGVPGRERLRVVARVMRPAALQILAGIGVAPGMSCLDVGAGGGDLAQDLAGLVAPGGRVLGIDIDEIKIDLAREEARQEGADNVTFEVAAYLSSRISACVAAGIAPHRLALDPGIGFGKRGAHNAQLLDEVAALHALGVPVVLGASRKGWIGALEAWPPEERLGGTLAAAMAGLDRGAQILRVHDVAQSHQVRLAWRALNHAL